MTVPDALFSPGYWDKSLEVADALRAQGPVHRAVMPNDVRVWVIGRYDHARVALADPRLSKDFAGLKTIIGAQLAEAGHEQKVSGMVSPHMLCQDGDEHTRLRKLVAAQFTRTRIEQLRPRIEQLTTALLDDLPRGCEVDLIESVAFPLPLTVICELLGVPVKDQSLLRAWTSVLMTDTPSSAVVATREMQDYFNTLIYAKHVDPGDDLLSALSPGIDSTEPRLSWDELMGTCFLLIVAGHETTMNLIGNAVRWLLPDPQRWRLLGQQPELVPGAVEEILRYHGPVRMATYRYTTEPVTVGGVTIPAGEIVLVGLQSANRDDDKFPHAAELDLHRDASGHLAFGHGTHYCLGATLGRMEAEIVLTALTHQFPNARLAYEDQLRGRPSVIIDGYPELIVDLG